MEMFNLPRKPGQEPLKITRAPMGGYPAEVWSERGWSGVAHRVLLPSAACSRDRLPYAGLVWHVAGN